VVCEISSSHGGEYEVQIVFWDVLPCKMSTDVSEGRAATKIRGNGGSTYL
jgi:hypothetical protein